MKSLFYKFRTILLLVFLLPLANLPTARAHNHYKGAGFGSDFAPFNFSDDAGHPIGIDHQVMDAIAKDQGFTVEKIDMPFNSSLQAVEQEQVDFMMAAMSVTEERKEIYDFTDPYFESSTHFAVSAKNEALKDLSDLKGHKIAVKTGAMGSMIATKLQADYGYEIIQYEDSTSMYQAVMGGAVSAVIDETPVMQYAISTGRVDLRLIGEPLEPAPLAAAVKKGTQAEFIQAFNAGLANIKADGTYAEIIETYLGEAALENTQVSGGFMKQLQTFLPELMQGLKVTLILAVISILIACVAGTALALMKLSQSTILRTLAAAYIDIIRGVPMIVLAFFIYFGIPQYSGLKIPEFVAGLLTITLNATAYIAEIIRGGIQGVDKGQVEAARSLGLPEFYTMWDVVFPQAFRLVIPSLLNQFIISIKDTSILSVIGIIELTQAGKIIIARTFQSGNVWLMVALCYLILITALSSLSKSIEKRLKVSQ